MSRHREPVAVLSRCFASWWGVAEAPSVELRPGRSPGMTAEERLQGVLVNGTRGRDLFGVVVRMEGDNDSFTWEGAARELESATPFFIASVTKLYTSAIVLRLAERGQLSLDDLLVDRADEKVVIRTRSPPWQGSWDRSVRFDDVRPWRSRGSYVVRARCERRRTDPDRSTQGGK